MPIHRKKRKFEMGRQASMTKLGEKKVINVRGRGGNIKRRALKLNEGNFTWISEQVTKKCKIVEVIYNATNNELVRTQTLVKNSIVAVDPTPFKYYWYIHYDDVKMPKLPEINDPERKKKLEEKREKLKSPYTIEHKEKANLWPIFYVIIGIVVFAIIVYIIVSNINKMPNRTDELCSYREENVLYEFAK